MMDEKETQQRKWLDEYRALTLDALESTESDVFIEILFKRDALIEKITKEDMKLEHEEITYFVELEGKILDRLEVERRDILQDIADIGEKKRAIRRYTPKFPFPPMPAFFDKKG